MSSLPDNAVASGVVVAAAAVVDDDDEDDAVVDAAADDEFCAMDLELHFVRVKLFSTCIHRLSSSFLANFSMDPFSLEIKKKQILPLPSFEL